MDKQVSAVVFSCVVYGFAIFVVVTNALFDLASSDKINQDSERLYYQFFGEKHDLNLEDLGPSI